MNKKALRIIGRFLIVSCLFISAYYRIINIDDSFKAGQIMYQKTNEYLIKNGLNLLPPKSHSKQNIEMIIYGVSTLQIACGLMLILCSIYGSFLLILIGLMRLFYVVGSNTNILMKLFIQKNEELNSNDDDLKRNFSYSSVVNDLWIDKIGQKKFKQILQLICIIGIGITTLHQIKAFKLKKRKIK